MSDFSRRHYKKVAHIISMCSSQHGDKEYLIAKFSEMFQQDNSQFDEGKFAEACGMNWKEHLEKAFTL